MLLCHSITHFEEKKSKCSIAKTRAHRINRGFSIQWDCFCQCQHVIFIFLMFEQRAVVGRCDAAQEPRKKKRIFYILWDSLDKWKLYKSKRMHKSNATHWNVGHDRKENRQREKKITIDDIDYENQICFMPLIRCGNGESFQRKQCANACVATHEKWWTNSGFNT